jgi:Tfp pilus assembly protein PilN
MTTRRINLLPPEFVERRRSRQRLAATVIAAVALIAVLVAVFLFEDMKLARDRRALATQLQTNDQLSAQVAELADFQRLQAELRRKTELLSSLTETEVRWSVVLADISLVIPQDVWLTNFTGNVGAQSGTPTASAAASSLGQIQMTGATFSHLDVAKWLIRLGQVDAFLFPYMSLSAKAKINTTNVVNFNSTVQLSDAAFRKNQPGAERRP